MSHNDWIPTLCAIAGEPDIVNKLKAGYTANGINYKVHLDGYDQSQFLRNVSGTAANNNGTKSARDKFFYSDDDGLLVGLRQGDYKYVFSEQRKEGTMGVWAEPFTTLRLQKIFNLMQDPFERADITSNTFWDWQHQSCRKRLRHEWRSLPVRGDIQGLPAAFVPAELQSREYHGKHAGQHEAEEGDDGGIGCRPDSRRPEQDDRTANPAARREIADIAAIPASRDGPVWFFISRYR